MFRCILESEITLIVKLSFTNSIIEWKKKVCKVHSAPTCFFLVTLLIMASQPNLPLTTRLPTKQCSSLPWSSYFPCPGDGLECSPKHRFFGNCRSSKIFWHCVLRIQVEKYQKRNPNQPPNYHCQSNSENRSDLGTFQLQMLKGFRGEMFLRTKSRTKPQKNTQQNESSFYHKTSRVKAVKTLQTFSSLQS